MTGAIFSLTMPETPTVVSKKSSSADSDEERQSMQVEYYISCVQCTFSEAEVISLPGYDALPHVAASPG